MKAVILAGGFGTRLRPLTNNIPKPMVPIIDKPILEYIIMLLRKHDICDIIITLGYKGDSIVNYFQDGKNFGVKIKYILEDKPLGTAGAIKNAEKYLDDDFLVMSGDAMTNINISRLKTEHKRSNALVTMAVKRVKDPTQFGVVSLDNNGLISSYVEKPQVPKSNVANMGIYVMKREILDIIPKGKMCDFSHDIFPTILPYMYACFSYCYWSDIGTLSSYYITNNYVASNSLSFDVRL